MLPLRDAVGRGVVLVVLGLPPVDAAAHEQVHHDATDQGVVGALGEDLRVGDGSRRVWSMTTGQHDAIVTCGMSLRCKSLCAQPAWSRAY